MAPSLPDMNHLDARLNSFAAIVKPKTRAKPAFPHSPATHPHLSAQALAEAGFYHTPGSSSSSLDTVRCFLCACELGGWEETDDPFEEHVKRKGCAWADIVCQGKLDVSRGRLRDDYDEPEELPASKESAKVRERTYEGWPHGRKVGWLPTPKNLAKAGFVFSPSSDATDCCLCPLCDLSMDGWEATDDPRAVHLRKSADCRFFTATLRGQIAESSTKALQKSQLGRGRNTRAQTVASEVAESVAEPDEHIGEEVDKPKRQRKPRGTTVAKPKATARATRKKAAPTQDEPEEPEEPDEETNSQAEDEVIEPQPAEPASQSSRTRKARRPKTQIADEESLGTSKSQRSTQSKSSRSKKTAATVPDQVTASEGEESEVAEADDDEAEEPLEETPKASKSSRAPTQPSKPSSRSIIPPPDQVEAPPPLSQLQRFANVPPASPAPIQSSDASRPIKPLKGSKSSRSIANIPRESLNKSLHQGALAARSVVEVIAVSPPIPLLAPSVTAADAAPQPEKLDVPLDDGEKQMTVEQLVRSEMKKRYDLMEREGEEMIRKWEVTTMDARRRIEGL